MSAQGDEPRRPTNPFARGPATHTAPGTPAPRSPTVSQHARAAQACEPQVFQDVVFRRVKHQPKISTFASEREREPARCTAAAYSRSFFSEVSRRFFKCASARFYLSFKDNHRVLSSLDHSRLCLCFDCLLHLTQRSLRTSPVGEESDEVIHLNRRTGRRLIRHPPSCRKDIAWSTVTWTQGILRLRLPPKTPFPFPAPLPLSWGNPTVAASDSKREGPHLKHENLVPQHPPR